VTKKYAISEQAKQRAWLNADEYQALYQHSIEDNDAFWREQAQQHLDWIKPFSQVKDVSFNSGDTHIRWFADGELNACYNCIDRHLPQKADQTAIIWEGDEPNNQEHISYQALYDSVCRMANVLLGLGVKKGDRVTIYMPMIPAAAYAMLACARIGAVHSVVFGGFSPKALAGRIVDCDSRWVVTADGGVRGGRDIPLKANVDAALASSEVNQRVRKVLVVKNTSISIDWNDQRDVWLHTAAQQVDNHCPPTQMNAEDPLFILYTSGSTGKPKGVLHTTAGYLLYALLTHRYVFDYHPGDIYWCTADVGWITGHSYIVYGPLANAATTLIFEGVPNYPDASRFWQICDKHQVNICYTAPTAIRSLMGEGEAPVKATNRQSLKLLGSVGEPINPEAWEWYYHVVGEGRCQLVDTWWQTETGGILISPLPGATELKPGSATRPFLGIQPAVLDEDGHVIANGAEGNLVISDSWPGQMRTVYGDHQRFVDTYFSTYEGYYFTGDGARCDADGDYWITGRIDDVLNVSGHRLGTAEVESALVSHYQVAEAAVVGYPDTIKGQGIYVFVTLVKGVQTSEQLTIELKQWVRQQIGPIAKPDKLQWAVGLPKTRSGKIMRRILRKIAADQTDDLGDISTLADPSVVADLIAARIH